MLPSDKSNSWNNVRCGLTLARVYMCGEYIYEKGSDMPHQYTYPWKYATSTHLNKDAFQEKTSPYSRARASTDKLQLINN